ncbi:tyrosine--tRNA ligase [Mycoplasmopsis verecunda]|uniref:Tyrosine--tRNA ligase n=1 Tax=Mycoplasmopsis verecunda TaxID=171291 RepID=A0A1T4LH18_9BACT|nr:tyrosine--tRNA ligase [Mycoplasmopsis verecunda]WPB54612.1 tyrosine--tRNA ligase [Mycoplasmopsis verecunda]SJZ54082.1 tyrosyl-tRNA synthetase [Mycoplasmopsis verecunda]
MTVIEDLRQRGILKQISNESKFNNLTSGDAVYCGFDPTATSLHLGNYIQIANLLRFKQYGYKVYAVLGGATGMIGDPSFKDAERQLLDNETLQLNKSKIKSQLEKYGLEVIDNYDFYKHMNILVFLRDVGKLVNVSYMLAKDSVATRIEKGLSFTEFSYQLIQGWDFLQLYKNKNVKVQFGGSDQWGNITTGLDMISTVFGNDHNAVAITANLLTDANGNKFGKSTGGGSLWLDPEKTKPYVMYQFLLNQPDSEISKLLNWLTFLDKNEIDEIIKLHNQDASKRIAQKALAFNVIKQVHNEEEAKKAHLASTILFSKDLDLSSIQTEEIAKLQDVLNTIQLKSNENLVSQLINLGVLKSKREAKEFIQNKALKVNLYPMDEDSVFTSDIWEGKYALLHIGKKNIYLVKAQDN